MKPSSIRAKGGLWRTVMRTGLALLGLVLMVSLVACGSGKSGGGGGGNGTSGTNSRPSAEAQSRAVAEGESLAITLTGQDGDGDALTFVVELNPNHGELSGTPPNLVYTPDSSFNGIDAFTFHAADPESVSDPVAVWISVYDPVAPADVTGIKARGGDGRIVLTWGNPSDVDLRGVRIRRSTVDPPAAPTDGVQVVDTAYGTTSHEDTGLDNGAVYYYAAFAFDDAAKFAAGVTASDVPHIPFTLLDAKRFASDAAADDQFGAAIAVSGDYAIVGLPRKNSSAGAAYVFQRNPLSGAWSEATKIVAPDAQANDTFGAAVGISGDYAIVGAWGEDGGDGDPLNGAGAAYIFHRTAANTWDQDPVATLVAPSAVELDAFGWAVAIGGDYAIVAAPHRDGDYGRVFAYRRTGMNSWDDVADVTPLTPGNPDRTGHSVAIDGDVAVVGAPNWGPTAEGVAYVVRRTGLNTWTTDGLFHSHDLEEGDQFGSAVAISGDFIAVGTPGDGGAVGFPNEDSGAVYVFRRMAEAAWDTGTKLIAPDTWHSDRFASAVAISGDTVVVGASMEDGGPIPPTKAESGSLYVFTRIGTNTWGLGTRVRAPDAEAGDGLGYAIAIGEDFLLGSAPTEDGGDGNPLGNAGAVYIFR